MPSSRLSSTVRSREQSSTRRISSTHSLGMSSYVAASVRSALYAGRTAMTFFSCRGMRAGEDISEKPGLHPFADRYARFLAGRPDGLVRLPPPPLPEHVQNAAGDDAVEEAFAVDVGWQNRLCTVAQRAEKVVHFGVFRTDHPLQIFLQCSRDRGRIAAGRDGDLDRAALDDGRDDELAERRHVDDVDRNAAAPAVGGDLLVHALMVGGGDDDVRPF